MAQKTVLDAIRDAIAEELRRDKRTFVLGEDVGRRGGVFRATQGLFPEFGEDRLLDTPLAEAAIAGVALGAAMRGMRPIAEIQFADFIWPTINQIIGEAAKVRYGTNGQLSAPMVLRTPYGGGVRGGLYHSQTPEAFFAHAAGLKVICPATPYDAKGLLKAAVRDDDPVIFFEHKRTYRGIRGEVPDEEYLIPIGKADVKRQGNDITIVTYGLMVHYSLEAAQIVESDGISVEVVDLRTVRPLDNAAILASAKKTGKVIIVHEDNKTGGLGGEIAAIIAEEAFEHLDGPIVRVAGPDVPSIAFAPTLEAEYMPSPEKIATAIRKLAAY